MPHFSSSLHYLRAFEAVARLGFVRAAAAEMHVTPGAVSQQIRALEDSVGLQLFIRDRNRLRLSQAGEDLRASSVRVFGELKACFDGMAQAHDDRPRKLTISAPPDFSVLWLTPAIFEFAEGAGIETLRTLTAREMAQIDWRSVDVALVYDTPPWPGYRWQSLGDLTLRPVCSPMLVNGPAGLRANQDLFDHCILHEDDGGEWQRWFNAAGMAGKPWRSAHFQSFTMAMLSAVEGHGIALASTLMAYDYLRAGRLIQPFAKAIPASKSYHWVCLESRSEEFLIRRFLDWVTERAMRALD